MTISIFFHFSGYKTFKDYYEKQVLMHMQSDFRGLVSYSRFVELKSKSLLPTLLFAKLCCAGTCTGTSFIDSFSLGVCHNARINSHKVFKGLARRGKTSIGWFYGFKVHLVINEHGEILDFCISKGNVADNNRQILKELTEKLKGKLFGDRGYIINSNLFEELFRSGVQLITRLRSNMKNKLMPFWDKFLLQKRGLIESVNGILKDSLSIEHTRHRSPANFLVHICSSLIAYFFRKNKPSIVDYSALLTMSC